jgi:hypothetical protein
LKNKIGTDQVLILGTCCLGAVSCYSESKLDAELWQWVTPLMGVEVNTKFGQDCNTLGVHSFMVSGLHQRCFSHGSTNAEMVAQFLEEVLDACQNAGLHVVATV